MWWDRLWIFVKVLTGGKPPPETEICWREKNKSSVSRIRVAKSSVQNDVAQQFLGMANSLVHSFIHPFIHSGTIIKHQVRDRHHSRYRGWSGK